MAERLRREGHHCCFFYLCRQVCAAELQRIPETRVADKSAHTLLPLGCRLGSTGLPGPILLPTT